MKNNFDRTKTATARFSTRAIAMMLFFVMLLTAIGSGSVLSAIAADFDTVSGDAIPAAATEGSNIALNAIPSEGAAVDNAEEKPDLSNFEENMIVRGMKDDLAPTGNRTKFTIGTVIYIDLTGFTDYDAGYIKVAGSWDNLDSNQDWGSGDGYATEKVTDHVYKYTITKDWAGIFVFRRGMWKNNNTEWDNYNPLRLFHDNMGSNNCMKVTGWDNISWSTYSPKTNYYLHYSSTDSGMESTTGNLMSDSSNTWTYTINDYNEDQIYFNVTTSSSATANTTSVTGNPTCSVGIASPSTGEHSHYQYWRSGLQGKPQYITFTFNSTTGALTVEGSLENFSVAPAAEAVTDLSSYSLVASAGGQTVSNSNNANTISVLEDSTVTVTVTPKDISKKVTAITVTGEGNQMGNITDNGDGSYSATFTLKANATLKATLATKTSYNVTPNTGTNGTVVAKKADGTVLPNDQATSVYEGTKVTFTAIPDAGYDFTGWTGISGKKTPSTVTVSSTLTVTPSFAPRGYQVITSAATNNTVEMKELPNGRFITTSTLAKDAKFTIKRTSTTEYIYSTAGQLWWIKDKNQKINVGRDGDQLQWRTTAPSGDGDLLTNKTSSAVYIMYDPEEDAFWAIENKDGYMGTTVYLKDGTVRTGIEGHGSCDFGDTALVTQGTTSGVTATPLTSRSDFVQTVSLTAAQVESGVDIVIKTTVNNTYKKQYYVAGFDVNGGLTQHVIEQEFDDDTDVAKAASAYTNAEAGEMITATNPYNQFTLHLEGYVDEKIEVTPIYFPKCASSDEFIRVQAYDFTDEVKEKWGGALAVYPYLEPKTGTHDGYAPYGKYPGQLMVNSSGYYYADIPKNLVKDSKSYPLQGLTFNNYIFDDIHYLVRYNGNMSNNDRNANQYQTYDYNEFEVINRILAASAGQSPDLSDEDIAFRFKYKDDKPILESNLGASIYFKDSDTNNASRESDYRYNYSTLNYNNPQYQWETLDDFYKHPIDIFGNRVDVESNTKKDYNPILAVSNGYDESKVGYFATAWALYVPVGVDDDETHPVWQGAYDHYKLFEVVGGQGRAAKDYPGESYLIDPVYEGRIKCKYGDESKITVYKAEFKQYLIDTGGEDTDGNPVTADTPDEKIKYPRHIIDLEHVPVKISYEYEGYSDKSNLGNQGSGGYAHRSDGRWYYTQSDQPLTAHTVISLANSKNADVNLDVRDYYQADQIDYSKVGYDPTKNVGLTSKVTAYFTNDDSVAWPDDVTKTNVSGNTEAYSVSDGTKFFHLHAAADDDGMYTFDGWYRLTENADGTIGYQRFSYDEDTTVKANTNDVFVARFYKTPAGNLQITHNLTRTSAEDSADCYSKVEVYNSSNELVKTYSERTSAITVEPKYVKNDSTYYLKIYVRNAPDSLYEFGNFYYDEDGTNTLDAADNNFFYSIADGANANEKVITTNALRTLFGQDDESLTAENSKINLYSSTVLPAYKYQFTYQYPAYVSGYGTQSYTVEGAFTPEELEHMQMDNTTLTYKDITWWSTFISNHAPAEDNFQMPISYASLTLTNLTNFAYNSTSYTVSQIVSPETTQNGYVYPTFKLPYGVDSNFVPTESSGKVEKLPSPISTRLQGRRCFEWVVTDGSTTQDQWDGTGAYDGQGKGNDPVFIKAPLIIDNGGKNEYFQYWSVRKVNTYTTEGGDEHVVDSTTEYTRCYDYEFNLSIFMDCEIEPIYSAENHAYTGAANYQDYTAFDPHVRMQYDVQQAKQNPSTGGAGVSISFLENSRNQYNRGNGGNIAANRKQAGDLIYSDFLLNFNNVATLDDNTPIELRKLEKGEKYGGLIIEAVNYMDKNTVGDKTVYDTTADYATKYAGSESDKSTAIVNWLQGGTKPKNVLKSQFDITSVDNKNCLQYAYSMYNRSLNSDPSKYGTDAELLDNRNNRYLVYRAYAYIGDKDGDNLKNVQISKPVYFTIYDLASIGLADK